MSISQQYTQLKSQYQNLYEQAHKTANNIAILRLIAVAVGLYLGYHAYNMEKTEWLIAIGFITIATFLFLVNQHLKYKAIAELNAALKRINEAELGYLNGDLKPFKTGKNYIQTHHPYSYDLDVFGENALFPHIDRTTTTISEKQLASWLKNEEQLDILDQQEAVRELGLNINWRQNFQANGQLYIDNDLDYPKFQKWLNTAFPYGEKSFLKILSYILPISTIIIFSCIFLSEYPIFSTLFKGLFFINLAIVGFQKKYFTAEHSLLNNTSDVLKKYSKMLQLIENHNFTAKILRGYQGQLVTENKKASVSIHQLSRILNQFDTVFNPFVAIFLNGIFQYHLHTLFKVQKWKNQHKNNVFQWFEAIGKFEALSSIGNFAYNHPDFIFPNLLQEPELIAQNMGHPLIKVEKRICNDVAFSKTKFVVLTGSNMSGKSTFLRTIGVNLILAKIGSPVCAEHFAFYPFNVTVSMRIDDSLQNSESLFFSEIKRLKSIIETLNDTPKPFIILDEILRGTNSNDKRAGTQGLIHKLIAKSGVGIIATHDLVIGDMIQEYPNYLSNKCFEAQIINDDLYFDYKIRDGVCQQMSAAFLMKKMEII